MVKVYIHQAPSPIPAPATSTASTLVAAKHAVLFLILILPLLETRKIEVNDCAEPAGSSPRARR
jgi:hypothetical protein